jgi:two-component system, OmpR family, phosphate regulon sensor histidine kinase PhoR
MSPMPPSRRQTEPAAAASDMPASDLPASDMPASAGRVPPRPGSASPVMQPSAGPVAFIAILFAVLASFALVGRVAWVDAILSVIVFSIISTAYWIGTASYRRDETSTGPAQRTETPVPAGPAPEALLIEAHVEPCFLVDAGGRLVCANLPARAMFRLGEPGSLLSAAVRRPDLLDVIRTAIEARARKRTQISLTEEATPRHFQCVATPLAREGGLAVLVTLIDQTDVRRAELARADFLANASHELRTPLTSIVGFIETMQGPAKDDPAAQVRFLEIMRAQAERMRRLIADLMSLSRIELNEHRHPSAIEDLGLVVREVVDSLAPVAAARAITLKLDLPGPDPIPVVAVRDELAQIAQNLIDNAIKYSPHGGVIEIAICGQLEAGEASDQASRQWPGAPRVSVVAPQRGLPTRYGVLRVRDHGQGIPREHLPRLAERFYRVEAGRDGPARGTGLGLAIVKHIVARHRGGFGVESQLGEGSGFGIWLPQSAADGD